MDREIVWSKRAKNQLKAALEYWLERNGTPEFSQKLIKETTTLLLRIAKNPELGTKWDHPSRRYCVVRSYKIFYDIKPRQIRVLLFWHSKQDPDRLVKFLELP